MTTLFAPLALLPDGWAENVRVTITFFRSTASERQVPAPNSK